MAMIIDNDSRNSNNPHQVGGGGAGTGFQALLCKHLPLLPPRLQLLQTSSWCRQAPSKQTVQFFFVGKLQVSRSLFVLTAQVEFAPSPLSIVDLAVMEDEKLEHPTNFLHVDGCVCVSFP